MSQFANQSEQPDLFTSTTCSLFTELPVRWRLVFNNKICLKHTHFNSSLGAQGSSETFVYTMYKRSKGER